MKTKQIDTGTNTLLLVELPEGAQDPVIRQNSNQSSIWYEVGKFSYIEDLPYGNWKLLCRLDEITSEIANNIVRKVTLGYWFDYCNPNKRHDYMKCTPVESFNSLLEANEVYFENPLGREKMQYLASASEPGDITYLSREWDKAQQNVYDKSRTYLLVKDN